MIRTDLALETHELLKSSRDESILPGVEVEEEEIYEGEIKVTRVRVTNDEGAESMGKPIGNYITIESDLMKINDVYAQEEIIKVFSDELGRLHNLKDGGSCLIIGLGNWHVTPDALGPKVVSKVLVTRHIKESISKEIQTEVRDVSAISPGVMGITGIETAETVKGIVGRVKPDLVIAVDALAARRTSRINSTIQICDTGISPGAGLGNNRKMLDEKHLGVKVIGIGVPTVVDAATLVSDTMDLVLGSMKSQTENGAQFYEMLESLESDEKYSMIKEILYPYSANMFVTPKEVDEVIDRLANIIANSLNISLHEGIGKEDINRYVG